MELFGEEFGKKTMATDRHVMETGEPVTGQVESYVNDRGETNWTSTTKMPLKNDAGEIIGLLGITREINEIKHSEIKMQWLATHDPLTGLENRVLLDEHINLAIQCSREEGDCFGLLFVDLNGFKEVNDRFGHGQGDRMLQTIAKVMTDNVRGMDTVARIGGDEFVVLLQGLKHRSDAKNVARKIGNLIKKNVDPVTHIVTASIGISIFPDDGEDPETLIKSADEAMYIAKNGNLGCHQAKGMQRT
jgi:diguanylate cyclase (GGDEF)-like protein